MTGKKNVPKTPISPKLPADNEVASTNSEKLDLILEKIRLSNESHNAKFESIFSQLKSIQDKQNERLDSQDAKIKKLESDVKNLSSQLKTTNEKLTNCEKALEKVNSRVIENESHSRRLNLIFGKVPESKDEDIRKTLNKIFIENLKVPREQAEGFLIRDAHRLGKSTTDNPNGVPKPRNIIVAFLNQGDRNFVFSQARNLQGSNISMRVDLCHEYAQKRDALLVHRREILKINKKAFVQLTYRSYCRPVLLVKRDGDIIEFDPDTMDYEGLGEVRGR